MPGFLQPRAAAGIAFQLQEALGAGSPSAAPGSRFTGGIGGDAIGGGSGSGASTSMSPPYRHGHAYASLQSPSDPLPTAWPAAAAPIATVHGHIHAPLTFSPVGTTDGGALPPGAAFFGESNAAMLSAATRHAALFSPPRAWEPGARQSADAEARWRAVKRRITGVMREYQWRVNGSVVREYDYTVAWDFRNADGEWAAAQAKFLAADLTAFVPPSVRVSFRKTQVEASLAAMDKGQFLLQTLAAAEAEARTSSATDSSGASVPPTAADAAGGDVHLDADADAGGVDFVLVAGDDVTDEPMFGAAATVQADPGAAGLRHAPRNVFSVLVGRPSDAGTRARFCLPDVACVHALLQALGAQTTAAAASAAAAAAAAASAASPSSSSSYSSAAASSPA